MTAAPYVFVWEDVPVGSYRISARATDNTGAATESAGVKITVDALTFNLWKAEHGIPSAAPGNTIGANGRPILLQYALNLDYEDPPVPRLDGRTLHLTYRQARSDVRYQVERSTDLANWSPNGVDQGTPAPFLVNANSPVIGDRTFLRLRISQP